MSPRPLGTPFTPNQIPSRQWSTEAGGSDAAWQQEKAIKAGTADLERRINRLEELVLHLCHHLLDEECIKGDCQK